MFVFNPPAVPITQMLDTQVYAAAAVVAWTDLDLSAITGALDTNVLLRIHKTAHTAGTAYAFRPNGDVDIPNIYDGANYANLPANGAGALVVCKAIAGIVEWLANNNDAVVIDIISFWRDAG